MRIFPEIVEGFEWHFLGPGPLILRHPYTVGMLLLPGKKSWRGLQLASQVSSWNISWAVIFRKEPTDWAKWCSWWIPHLSRKNESISQTGKGNGLFRIAKGLLCSPTGSSRIYVFKCKVRSSLHYRTYLRLFGGQVSTTGVWKNLPRWIHLSKKVVCNGKSLFRKSSIKKKSELIMKVPGEPKALRSNLGTDGLWDHQHRNSRGRLFADDRGVN